MNEDDWMIVTSSEESCDSDKIDSDIEAELYSAIHHETATARTSTDLSNPQSPQITITSPNKSPVIKHGSANSDSPVNFKTPEVTVNKYYSNIGLRKSDASGDDFNTSLKTPNCLVTTDHSNLTVEKRFNASVDKLYASFETPEVIVKKGDSDMNSKRKSDVPVIELSTSFDSPDVKVIKDISNTSVKRKSVVLNESRSEVNIDESSHKKPKMTRRERQKASRMRKEFERISALNKSDSSDSDSIVFSEVECDIELNTSVEPEVVALSSDSFSSEESCEPFREVCSFTGNNSQPSTSSNSNDPWHINSDDLYRSKGRGYSSRYHERAVLKCTACKQNGHTVKFCSTPKEVKCFVCGGRHASSCCNLKMCSKCFQRGHDARFCRKPMFDLCGLCNMRGHSVQYCPDLWRRYHLTTNHGKIVIANPVPQDTPIYCFNCGEKGHYGAECRLLRPDKFQNHQTWTSVIAHVHPGDTIRRMREDRRNVALGGAPNWPAYQHCIPPPIAFPQSPMPTQKMKKKKKTPNPKTNLQSPMNEIKERKRAIILAKRNERKELRRRKKAKKREFSFPRTPKSAQNRTQETFMNGLHRRLGVNPETGLPNNGFR